MKHILPTYYDPLFSILIIIIISLIIALINYGWSIYIEQKEERNLKIFLKKFDTSKCTLDTTNMLYEENMLKPLILLSKAFENSGEYDKSITIYLYLIKHISDYLGQAELMERLGNLYLRAGFLERSKSIYKEILRKTPRNIKVLYELGIVYETMHQYEKAKEVLEPLEILKEDIYYLKNFLDFSQLVADKKLEKNIKIDKIKNLLLKDSTLYRYTISTLLKLDMKIAWKTIDSKRIEEILDILWFLPNSQLDLGIIKTNKELQTLYYAKGYLQDAIKDSTIFTVNMLATAKEGGFQDGDLTFSYLCKKCKNSFPISFQRCPNCMAINSIKVEERIIKLSPNSDYSLL